MNTKVFYGYTFVEHDIRKPLDREAIDEFAKGECNHLIVLEDRKSGLMAVIKQWGSYSLSAALRGLRDGNSKFPVAFKRNRLDREDRVKNTKVWIAPMPSLPRGKELWVDPWLYRKSLETSLATDGLLMDTKRQAQLVKRAELEESYGRWVRFNAPK